MSSLQIGLTAAAAVLLFWAVGAYNRLMELRNAILQGFAAVDRQLAVRHVLLQRGLDSTAASTPEPAQAVAALRAACAQAHAAAAHARAHPGAPGALNSLRLAEEILQRARAQRPSGENGGAGSDAAMDARTADDSDAASLSRQLDVADAALQLARGRFNEAVMEYNHAVQQFPTRLLAALFGFRAAGVL